MTSLEGDSNPGQRHAGTTIMAAKDRIISQWVALLRAEVPQAAREEHLILVDTLPAILDHLAETLNPEDSRPVVTHGSTLAAEHGGERVRLTSFRLEDLITEYRLLRRVLFEVLEEERALSREERNIINGSLDGVLREACTGYSLVQSTLRTERFAMVAHDLRSPLNAVHTTAHVLLAGGEPDQVPKLAERIIDNVGRADRMVQDLLDAARAETGGRLPLQLTACDLVEIVREAMAQLEAEHGRRFRLVAPGPVPGYFGRDQLRRAVENLASNAVKYGSGSEPITLRVSRGHHRATLTVHNHGEPIAAEKQETLFRAFQRSSAAEQSGPRGWGLGLAQVRAVAEAHGGSIGVDSAPDRGTTFMIDIPEDARPFQHQPLPPWDRQP